MNRSDASRNGDDRKKPSKIAGLFNRRECKDVASPSGKTVSDFSEANGRMTPKTPLTSISRMLSGRKLRSSPAAGFETDEDKLRLLGSSKKFAFSFWRIVAATAVLSSTLSFGIDQFTFAVGTWREQFTNFTSSIGLAGIVLFNVVLVLLARLIVRTTMECEGSGFPEMKAMLFGQVLDNYLTLRVLCVKAVGLALTVGAGLPVGKEGPNCHMAACIARNLDSNFIDKRAQHAQGQSQISKLLMAACAVGVGATFSAPIGGVIFAFELMLPQIHDFTSYWGCFASAVLGSFVYGILRTWFAGATGLLPLMSTDVKPLEGAASRYPCARMLVDVLLGLIAGALGGLWIRWHARCAKAFKDWRLRKQAAGVAVSPGEEPLLGGPARTRSCADKITSCWPIRCIWNFQWRDLFLCALVTVMNTLWAAYLPLLNGKPQPVLLSDIFDKNLLATQDEWVLPALGVTGTLLLCVIMKWFTTIMALSLSMPTGVVAPTMIIGGLLGRCYALLIPEAIKLLLLCQEDGTPPMAEAEGAFMARMAIIGAAAFCAAVCRTFAMAITVFEVLALPYTVIPLCSSTLVAIFVANHIELPFFDKNLAGRGLGGIPALTFTGHADNPAFSIMKRLDVNSDCLRFKCRLYDMHELLKTRPNMDYFPIVRPLEDDQAVLVGAITRENLDKVIHLLDPMGNAPETLVDMMDPELQRPSDGSPSLVDGCPPHVAPSTTIMDVYLVMKVAYGQGVLYVTREGCLLGEITFASLLTDF